VYIAFTALTVVLGLFSRKYGHALHDWLAAYAGDTLWGLCVYLAWSVVVPGKSMTRRGVCALLIAWTVEVSQLYQAPWINELRRTTAGALALGQGFLWSDLVCYAAGVGTGVVIESLLNSRLAKRGGGLESGA
jgi:hypothetical protein